ncbi:MAG: tetratricopeptide repeat protein, partial [Candidatus Electrothrix sp. AR5]|nr:tetratricopeptide repeat protein [Candidatus Electrothrix sp. AR5]
LEILFHALIPLYPGKQGLQAVRPDLLGEALVGMALRRNGAGNLLDAVLSHDVDKSVRHHALTVIARLSDQRPDLHETLIDALSRHFAHCYREILQVAVETGGDLSQLAEIAFNRLPWAAQSQLAGLLKPLLIEEASVQLASLACAVSGFLVKKAQLKYTKKKKNVKCMAEYAGRMLNHSVDLCWAGRRELALSTTRKALKLFKQLYGKNQQRHSQNYSTSLNNMANRLAEAGQYEDALRHNKQALEISQRLAKRNPDQYEPGYAISLNNIAVHLNDTGKYEEALWHAEQALEISQRMARKNPDPYEPDYAILLNNIAGDLSNAGRYEEAFSRAGQALEINQRLAQKNPDRYEPDYAMSLNNIASYLS